jgi:ABC-2 type transport system ATP-binding protein
MGEHRLAVIAVTKLEKSFRVTSRASGLGAAMRSLWKREYKTVRAVDGVTFSIEPGERVGFLGPNGAGKTTTLKMLAGLLHPTGGEIRVDGFLPQKRQEAFLRRITLVLGQKQQLLWDLPPLDTFELNRAVYGIEARHFKQVLGELSEMLHVGDTVRRPTRQLSLGERMKCELVCALLHEPKVLFLDEPTIGLDVNMQSTVREFIRDYNERHGATLILTSHYMADVSALCPRVIVIDQGVLRFDGTLGDLVRRTRPYKQIDLSLARPYDEATFAEHGEIKSHTPARVVLRVDQDKTSRVMAQLLARVEVTDVTVSDPPLEEIMADVFVANSEHKVEG